MRFNQLKIPKKITRKILKKFKKKKHNFKSKIKPKSLKVIYKILKINNIIWSFFSLIIERRIKKNQLKKK